ncbi:transposase [Marinospirillum insulare]|uniref:Transposase n=2 Tax=Marinospirillum insulare TaxID=217169 RepID=A0ABQ5ZRK0_9GAMM|nr:transposase [Marinospirillum insulare]GLR62769.1 hypothetical protein GCM10007878_02040 [Marinospirillum insulare]
MASYSTDFREQMIRKMMPPNSQSVAQIARDTGLPYATLYTWKKQYQSRGFVVPAKNTNATQWDAKTKLAAIIQTAAMNEAERSEYCRQNGLYVEQLNEWKEDFESSGVSSPTDKRALAAERKKSRKLEKELLRKDRALAETAALLTLSKKAQAIWGISEED